MVEIEKINYEIIISDFNGTNIEFFEREGQFWITSTEIAKALGINTSSVWKIFNRHKTRLEAHSAIVNLAMGDRPRDTRIFDKTACIFIGVRSNSDEAIPFQEWIMDVIDSVVKTGQYIEKTELSPLEALLKQNEALGRMLTNQIEQQKKLAALESKVDNVDTGLKQFEQKYKDEKLITPQTRRKIQDIINQCKVNSGKGWGYFHAKYKKAFGISAYKDISEILGQKIISWMKSNPAFNRYMDLSTLI